MEHLTDEKIQQLLENHMIIETTHEVKLYQKIFSGLSKYPDVHVDPMAQDVVFAIQNGIERRAVIKTYLIIVVSLAVASLVFVTGHFI